MLVTRIYEYFCLKTFLSKGYAHIQLARLNQPIGIWLLLLPTLWGLILASEGVPPLYWVVVLCIGGVAMRSAGCAINDTIDAKFDRSVARTKNRPLAAGRLSRFEALVHIGLMLTVAFSCFLTLPLLAKKISLGALVLTFVYPFMKRFTYWPQVFLGLCFNGTLIAGTTVQAKITPAQILLYFSAVVWTVFFDTIYAHQDKKDDQRIGVKSTALLLNRHTKPFLLACALMQVLLLSLVGALSLASGFYYAGCALILLYLVCQIVYVDLDNPTSCVRAFKSNHLLGWIILLNISLIFYIQ